MGFQQLERLDCVNGTFFFLIRLRTFDSGVMVLQAQNQNEEELVNTTMALVRLSAIYTSFKDNFIFRVMEHILAFFIVLIG